MSRFNFSSYFTTHDKDEPIRSVKLEITISNVQDRTHDRTLVKHTDIKGNARTIMFKNAKEVTVIASKKGYETSSKKTVIDCDEMDCPNCKTGISILLKKIHTNETSCPNATVRVKTFDVTNNIRIPHVSMDIFMLPIGCKISQNYQGKSGA